MRLETGRRLVRWFVQSDGDRRSHDGVFTLESADERMTFQRLPVPSPNDLEEIALDVSIRVGTWLRRHRLLRTDDDDNAERDTRKTHLQDGCARADGHLHEEGRRKAEYQNMNAMT